MDTITLDANAMNRFISSLSKSLQALCHGCMDFDSGIEMIGYININIDRENSIDCVLNEKVKRSSETNSMTFISNSFMAKKEIAKATYDASCSPIPECTQSKMRATKVGEHRSSHSRKRPSVVDGHRLLPGRKRHHKENLRTYDDFPIQRQIQEPVLDFSDNQVDESDYSVQGIKKEADESGSYLDPSSFTIKTEINELPQKEDCPKEKTQQELSLGHLSSAQISSAPQSCEPELNSSLPQSHFTPQAKTISPHQHLQDVEQNKESAEDGQSRDSSHHLDPPKHEQPSFLEEAEVSSNVDQFEVIEIDDEDEEVQGIFAQSGHPNSLGQHEVRPCHSGLVWNGHTSLDLSTYYAHHVWKEKKRQASRVYRLNMTCEQRERERWLARIRQRRRRAKLRQQVSGGHNSAKH